VLLYGPGVDMNRRRFALPCITWLLAATAHAAGSAPIPVNDKSFGCINHLKPVRGFFVGNFHLEVSGAVSTGHRNTVNNVCIEGWCVCSRMDDQD